MVFLSIAMELLFANAVSAGKSSPVDDKLKAPSVKLLLYNHSNYDSIPATPPLLPNRVYVHYEKDLKMWVYAKTNLDGEFVTPSEAFLTGSVVPGLIIGASDVLQMYKLEKEGEWKPTKEEQNYIFWVKTNPPRTRFIPSEAGREAASALAPFPQPTQKN